MTPSAIDAYRGQIERELQAGNATEDTHRPPLRKERRQEAVEL